MNVVCEAGDGRELMECLKAHSIDIVILDISLPGKADWNC